LPLMVTMLWTLLVEEAAVEVMLAYAADVTGLGIGQGPGDGQPRKSPVLRPVRFTLGIAADGQGAVVVEPTPRQPR